MPCPLSLRFHYNFVHFFIPHIHISLHCIKIEFYFLMSRHCGISVLSVALILRKQSKFCACSRRLHLSSLDFSSSPATPCGECEGKRRSAACKDRARSSLSQALAVSRTRCRSHDKSTAVHSFFRTKRCQPSTTVRNVQSCYQSNGETVGVVYVYHYMQ